MILPVPLFRTSPSVELALLLSCGVVAHTIHHMVNSRDWVMPVGALTWALPIGAGWYCNRRSHCSSFTTNDMLLCHIFHLLSFLYDALSQQSLDKFMLPYALVDMSHFMSQRPYAQWTIYCLL